MYDIKDGQIGEPEQEEPYIVPAPLKEPGRKEDSPTTPKIPVKPLKPKEPVPA